MNQPAAKQPSISEETVNRMLATQAKDQEIKARELDIRQQELKASATYAHSMLDAQLADRNSERAYNAKLQTYRLLRRVRAIAEDRPRSQNSLTR